MSLGVAIAGGKSALSTSDREADDFYPTPPEATYALIGKEKDRLNGRLIWEPCGRGGQIIEALKAFGFESVASDLVADPDHGVIGKDIFSFKEPMSPCVVTNPPFVIAEEIIRFLIDDLACDYAALLLKATFWHAATRTPLFDEWKPARIYALNWRLDFLGGGNPAMDCMWVVWDRLHSGATEYSVIGKGSNPHEPTLFEIGAAA